MLPESQGTDRAKSQPTRLFGLAATLRVVAGSARNLHPEWQQASRLSFLDELIEISRTVRLVLCARRRGWPAVQNVYSPQAHRTPVSCSNSVPCTGLRFLP